MKSPSFSAHPRPLVQKKIPPILPHPHRLRTLRLHSCEGPLMPTLLHWFRRDFRLHDNTALIHAATRAGRDGSVLGVFIIDPRWWRAEHQKLGPFQARFWLDSLAELQKNLAARQIPLIFRTNPDPVK